MPCTSSQKLYGYSVVTEEVRKKGPVRSTVFPQHRTSGWWFWNKQNPPQALVVFG